jgi:hypothetical protein
MGSYFKIDPYRFVPGRFVSIGVGTLYSLKSIASRDSKGGKGVISHEKN